MRETEKTVRDWHKFLVSYRKKYGYKHFKVKIDMLMWLEMKALADKKKHFRNIIDPNKGTFSGAEVIPTYVRNEKNMIIVLNAKDIGVKRWLVDKAYTIWLKIKIFFLIWSN